MNRFIKDNKKKLFALFSAALMVVFLLPGMSNSRGGTDPVEGRINGQKVYASAMRAGVMRWNLLGELRYQSDDPRMGAVSIAAAILGQQNVAQINAKKETFFLLAQEARQQQIAISEDQINSFMKNELAEIPADVDRDMAAEAVGDLLQVATMLNRVGDMVKFSRTADALYDARVGQMVSLDVALYPAISYLDQVGQPTAENLHDQFFLYSDTLAKTYTPRNPLGFGYKIPDAIKLEYVGVSKTEMEAAARKQKSQPEWFLAAYREFQKSRDYYDKQLLPSTTQPTTQPVEAATPPASTRTVAGKLSTTRTLASSQPSTKAVAQKLDDPAADFALHKDLVLDDLYQEQSRQLSNDILKTIRQTMAADFSAWQDAQTGHGAATQPASSLGAVYDSEAYMPALAQKIKDQYKIAQLTLGVYRQWQEMDDLPKLEGIGKAELPVSAQQALTFANYALRFIEPLATEQIRSSPLKLAVWQPSMPVFTENFEAVFRVTAVRPGHAPASQAEVTAQLAKDWRMDQAFALAQKDALAAKANADADEYGLAEAAGPAHPLLATEFFDQQATAIAPLKLQDQSVAHLRQAAFQLLQSSSGKIHPVAEVELNADATAAAIELRATKSNPEYLTPGARLRPDQQQLVNNLRANWCQPDNVRARVHYVPENGK